MDDFISEDDLKTFCGWLRYQGVDESTTPPAELSKWRSIFDDVQRDCASYDKVGLMKLKPAPGEFKYAVAVREGAGLFLVLWIRRSPKGDFFVLRPVSDPNLNPHTSYHRDGTFHEKSHDDKVLPPQKRQPLNASFRGIAGIGMYHGFAPRGVGAICDPAAFSGVVEVSTGVLGPRHGAVAVELVEPGHSAPSYPCGYEVVSRSVFCDVTPNIVITVISQKTLNA